MGVELIAYVEQFSPGDDDGEIKTNDLWWLRGTWEFSKDYALQRAVDTICTDGWPRDASVDPYNEPEHDLDTKQCCAGEALIRLAARIEKYDEEKDLEGQGKPCAYWPASLKALAAAIKVLADDGAQIRVLFGRS